jgi:hypothetical protein
VLGAHQQAFLLGIAVTVAGERHREADRDAGKRRMHAGFEHAHPGEQAEQDIERGLARIEEVQDREAQDSGARERERDQRKLVGIEDRDHDDGHQGVDDGERQQKRLEQSRHRADPDREADIGGPGDRPAAQGFGAAQVQRHIDGGRHHEAADRRNHRQRRLTQARERALAGLALDLETEQQKEDRHQAVVDPMLERLGEADRPDPDLAGQMQQCGVSGLEGGICDHEGDEGRQPERQAAEEIGPVASVRWHPRMGL